MTKDDRYYQESIEGVQAVLERMMKLLNNPPGGYAEALNINENTIKTWRKRGAVSLKYLQGFAKEHNVSIDYLIRGSEGDQVFQRRLEAVDSARDMAVNLGLNEEQGRLMLELLYYAETGNGEGARKCLAELTRLGPDESALLDNYRHCPPDGKNALKTTSAALAQPKSEMKKNGKSGSKKS